MTRSSHTEPQQDQVRHAQPRRGRQQRVRVMERPPWPDIGDT
jgi:hypothetical protein